MSKEVKRYDCTDGGARFCQGCYRMSECEFGEYVSSEDYDSLLAERDALAKDAERYRWLMRELGGSVSQAVMGSPVFSDEDVAASIDAALQGEQP